MDHLLEQLRHYLHETLDEPLEQVTPWPEARLLPPYLRERYGFWRARLMDRLCLLLVDQGRQEQTPAIVRKHMDQVQVRWPDEVIYVCEALATYTRKQLVKQRVPFVVPGTQMYLPTFGIDFRERFRRKKQAPQRMSPGTQAAMIYWLLNGPEEPLTPMTTARCLGLSPMTMTRAFDELEAMELAEVARKGKERQLRFGRPRPEVWAKARPFLRSPVTKRVWLPQPPALPPIQAGLSALAHYTMLAAPDHPAVAVYGQDSKWLPLWHNKKPIPKQEPGAVEIEVWSYRPELFADKNVADPFSLYLSLRDEQDERVQAALEEMMSGVNW